MDDTIKAEVAYHVVAVRNIVTGEEGFRVDDGCEPLFVAKERSYQDFLDEREQNETFWLCDVFTTAEGQQYIYWRDEEMDADYLTEL